MEEKEALPNSFYEAVITPTSNKRKVKEQEKKVKEEKALDH
jgi:hypothetical protein